MIENHVITLEQAKRLNELGVDSLAMLYHIFDNGIDRGIQYTDSYDWNDWPGWGSSEYEKYPAYTASELMELINTPNADGLYIEKAHQGYTVEYVYGHKGYPFYGENICQLLAQLLIHLLENNIIKL